MSALSRREFTELVAAAAVAPWVGRKDGTVEGRQVASPTPSVLPSYRPAPDPIDAQARALTEAVRARYGERLSAAELETVRRQIADTLRRAERLRAVELANGDEPDFVFRAHAPQGAAPERGARG